jgi:hypothetical protein
MSFGLDISFCKGFCSNNKNVWYILCRHIQIVACLSHIEKEENLANFGHIPGDGSQHVQGFSLYTYI